MGIRDLQTGIMGLHMELPDLSMEHQDLNMVLQDLSKDILPSKDIQEISKHIQEISKGIPPNKDIQEDSMGLQSPNLNMEIRDTTIKACSRVQILEHAGVVVNSFSEPLIPTHRMPSITVVTDAQIRVLKTSVLCPNFDSHFWNQIGHFVEPCGDFKLLWPQLLVFHRCRHYLFCKYFIELTSLKLMKTTRGSS